MLSSYKTMWKYTFNFYSLENKKTFWQAFCLHFIILAVVWTAGLVFAPLLILSLLYTIVSALPFISLCVRRLHDADTSGLYLLMALIPIAGVVFVILRLLEKSSYNPNTKEAEPKPKNTKNASHQKLKDSKKSLATDPENNNNLNNSLSDSKTEDTAEKLEGSAEKLDEKLDENQNNLEDNKQQNATETFAKK